MDSFYEFLLTLFAQFGGGPGPPENNLVRFGLAALCWGVLLIFTWAHQRGRDLPRERWLLIGFGLAFFRDAFMFTHLALRLIRGTDHDVLCMVAVPFEHALTLAAVVVIAGAFLRYILDDRTLAIRYMKAGLGLTAVVTVITFAWWPWQLAIDPQVRFHTTWQAWFIHSVACTLLLAAIVILIRNQGWLRTVVATALSLLFISELIVLVNLLTNRAYSQVLCPLGNVLYIAAIPLFGLVYFREQAFEKEQAEAALRVYRDQLEELVDTRTAALTAANKHAAAMEERQRIAADMHDGLAQTLSYLRLKTDHTAGLLDAGRIPDALDEIDGIQHSLGQAVCEVRESIASLQTQAPLRLSLQAALAAMVAANGGDNFPAVVLEHVLDGETTLQPEVHEQVIRIVQEAVTNCRNHAEAARISISLAQFGPDWRVTVTDDGKGFNPADPFSGGESGEEEHFGLSIMRARAVRIHGRLTVESAPGRGTVVTLTWPAGPSRAAAGSGIRQFGRPRLPNSQKAGSP